MSHPPRLRRPERRSPEPHRSPIFRSGISTPGKLPNASILVSRQGQDGALQRAGQGGRGARQRPSNEDTIFRIYSMTKPLTSVLFMMLVEEGKVALEDPVHRYIPEWRNLGRLPGRVHGDVPDHPLQARPDADRGPVAPHLRSHLRLPGEHEYRRRLSQARHRHVRDEAVEPRGDNPAAGEGAAGVQPRRPVELFGLHRHPRLPDPGDRGEAVRAGDEGSPHRPAGDDGHRLPTCRRKRPTASPPATSTCPGKAPVLQDDPTRSALPQGADLRRRRRRARLDHERLPEVLHHAAEQGRAERRRVSSAPRPWP